MADEDVLKELGATWFPPRLRPGARGWEQAVLEFVATAAPNDVKCARRALSDLLDSASDETLSGHLVAWGVSGDGVVGVDVRGRLQRVLHMLAGGSSPSRLTIDEARSDAIPIALGIVRGEVDAYAGAMKIWKELIKRISGRIPDDLRPFRSNASLIEDCLSAAQETGSNQDDVIARCRAEIAAAAGRLVSTVAVTPPTGKRR